MKLLAFLKQLEQSVSDLHIHKITSYSFAVMHTYPSSEYAKDLKHLDLDIESPHSLKAVEQFQIPCCYTSTSVSNAQRIKMHKEIQIPVFSGGSDVKTITYLKVLDDSNADHVGFVLRKSK